MATSTGNAQSQKKDEETEIQKLKSRGQYLMKAFENGKYCLKIKRMTDIIVYDIYIL